jgi:hypothetical protein
LLCQLSYRRMRYRVSRCAVCLRHRGQNFDSSIRSGSFFRFFVVAYVRDRQVEHASVMIGRLSFGMAYSMTFVTAPAPTVWPPSRMANRSPSSRAIGVMSVIVRFTVSPGITISVPLGSSAEPVTSVVRM